MTRFTVLVAALETRSALRATAVHTADAIAAHTGVPACIDVIDLAALGPALLAEEATDGVADALATIAATDVLIVATPQIHGSYTGLLKVFLDRLPELGLAHVIALPLAVVDDLRNGYNIESDLRVLLSDLGAWVAEPGLVLATSELAEPLSVVDAWAEVAAPSLRQALAVAVRRAQPAGRGAQPTGFRFRPSPKLRWTSATTVRVSRNPGAQHQGSGSVGKGWRRSRCRPRPKMLLTTFAAGGGDGGAERHRSLEECNTHRPPQRVQVGERGVGPARVRRKPVVGEETADLPCSPATPARVRSAAMRAADARPPPTRATLPRRPREDPADREQEVDFLPRHRAVPGQGQHARATGMMPRAASSPGRSAAAGPGTAAAG